MSHHPRAFARPLQMVFVACAAFAIVLMFSGHRALADDSGGGDFGGGSDFTCCDFGSDGYDFSDADYSFDPTVTEPIVPDPIVPDPIVVDPVSLPYAEPLSIPAEPAPPVVEPVPSPEPQRLDFDRPIVGDAPTVQPAVDPRLLIAGGTPILPGAPVTPASPIITRIVDPSMNPLVPQPIVEPEPLLVNDPSLTPVPTVLEPVVSQPAPVVAPAVPTAPSAPIEPVAPVIPAAPSPPEPSDTPLSYAADPVITFDGPQPTDLGIDPTAVPDGSGMFADTVPDAQPADGIVDPTAPVTPQAPATTEPLWYSTDPTITFDALQPSDLGIDPAAVPDGSGIFADTLPDAQPADWTLDPSIAPIAPVVVEPTDPTLYAPLAPTTPALPITTPSDGAPIDESSAAYQTPTPVHSFGVQPADIGLDPAAVPDGTGVFADVVTAQPTNVIVDPTIAGTLEPVPIAATDPILHSEHQPLDQGIAPAEPAPVEPAPAAPASPPPPPTTPSLPSLTYDPTVGGEFSSAPKPTAPEWKVEPAINLNDQTFGVTAAGSIGKGTVMVGASACTSNECRDLKLTTDISVSYPIGPSATGKTSASTSVFALAPGTPLQVTFGQSIEFKVGTDATILLGGSGTFTTTGRPTYQFDAKANFGLGSSVLTIGGTYRPHDGSGSLGAEIRFERFSVLGGLTFHRNGDLSGKVLVCVGGCPKEGLDSVKPPGGSGPDGDQSWNQPPPGRPQTDRTFKIDYSALAPRPTDATSFDLETIPQFSRPSSSVDAGMSTTTLEGIEFDSTSSGGKFSFASDRLSPTALTPRPSTRSDGIVTAGSGVAFTLGDDIGSLGDGSLHSSASTGREPWLIATADGSIPSRPSNLYQLAPNETVTFTQPQKSSPTGRPNPYDVAADQTAGFDTDVQSVIVGDNLLTGGGLFDRTRREPGWFDLAPATELKLRREGLGAAFQLKPDDIVYAVLGIIPTGLNQAGFLDTKPWDLAAWTVVPKSFVTDLGLGLATPDGQFFASPVTDRIVFSTGTGLAGAGLNEFTRWLSPRVSAYFGKDLTLHTALSAATMGVIPITVGAVDGVGEFARTTIGCPTSTAAGAGCRMVTKSYSVGVGVAVPIALELAFDARRVSMTVATARELQLSFTTPQLARQAWLTTSGGMTRTGLYAGGAFTRTVVAGAPVLRNVAWQIAVAQVVTSPTAITIYDLYGKLLTGRSSEAAGDYWIATQTPQTGDGKLTYRVLNLFESFGNEAKGCTAEVVCMAPLVRAWMGCDAEDWIICPGTPGHPNGEPRLGPYKNTYKPPEDWREGLIYKAGQLTSGDTGAFARAWNGCDAERWIRCPTATSAGVPRLGQKVVGPRIVGEGTVGVPQPGDAKWGRGTAGVTCDRSVYYICPTTPGYRDGVTWDGLSIRQSAQQFRRLSQPVPPFSVTGEPTTYTTNPNPGSDFLGVFDEQKTMTPYASLPSYHPARACYQTFSVALCASQYPTIQRPAPWEIRPIFQF
jgi:hypothetical protein